MMIPMTERIPQHTHCNICGKAVPVSETLCSDECKQKYDVLVKKRKLWVYIMYAAIFGFFILLLVQLTGTQ